ncbi:TEL2-interacting protein [Lachnellula hyalina]|uniref:TEL2-interacting protein n=1 Tax=Lachnellula hyalina TaxID=1316788 RepID=A0A8H8U3X3_9HELO|nr:TEL2-interacting protein [Lachnellula hyalina]TVY30733.1 TEL2-interacting protein [Lachnellula hyalina]
MDSGARSARNGLFQELKPCCVELSQLALRDDGSSNSTKSLTESTNKLLIILEQKCMRVDDVFDEKLADYVFFPLSQTLKRKQKYTDRLSELTIKCLRILLEYGWRRSIALDLARQLIILLAFVAGGPPDQKPATISEELAAEAYGALAALFKDMKVTPGGAAALVETGTIPALGHCVTVILDGITDGSSVEVQLQALRALDALWRCIKDSQALATFLPGTISGLTKFLMPGTASRRSRKNLVTALEVLEQVLISILSDIRTRTIRDKLPEEPAASSAEQKVLTKPWLKATTAQIKLALSSIIRLRKHDAADVREALNRLCLTILDECHATLSDSASLLVETCMILDGIDQEDDLNARKTTLSDLASIHPDIGELVKNTSYNWVTSLPRIMQTNDESAKNSALQQLSRANCLLKQLKSDSSILEDALGSSLRDSITVTLEASPAPKGLEEADFDMNSQAALTLVADNALSTQFRPVVLGEQSQRETRKKLIELLDSLGTRESQINMAGEMLEYVRGASGQSLLAAYWLSFQVLKSSASKNEDIDEFFDSAVTLADEQEAMNEELMSYSQSILANTDGNAYDWRMQAIALEVVADRAQRLKESFRPELIDTLYPVASLLGSSNDRLREHAITSLNIISKSCGHNNASELIVDNVDYMVNAVSLRLNTFDISPQAPQILVMMIRLAGPSLLLYLDDVVGSIFAALDNFHGYQRLVDVLFSVLDEIVKVGSTAPQFQLPAPPEPEQAPPLLTIADIASLITPKPPSPSLEHEEFPRQPWKSAQTLLDEAAAAAADPASDTEEEAPPPPQDLAPALPSKTHLLLHAITSHAQHHLTSSSPLLRHKLLTLINTSTLSLSNSPSSSSTAFLPLINDIWPVLLPRIHDPEPYVSLAAMSTIRTLCLTSGPFLATRIAVEWASLLAFARKTKTAALAEKKSKRGVFGEGQRMWEGVVGLLCAVVRYVGVEEQGFADVLEVLGSEVWERDGVREDLSKERGNGDWVWLVCYEAGREREGIRERPKGVGEFEFIDLEQVA